MQKAYRMSLLWVLAALGFLSGAVAHAQVSLNSLAPNTVVGRLGAGQTGGAQAIPFATLLAQLNGLPSLISGPGSVTSGHVVTWGASNTSLLDSGIASSLVAQNATASPAAGCVQFDGSSHLTSTGANCGNAGATAPGGSTTQVQFNSSGSFAGSAEFVVATGSGTFTITDGGNGAGFGFLVINNSGSSVPSDVIAIPSLKVSSQGGAGDTGAEFYAANGASTINLANSGGSASSRTATTGTMAGIRAYGYDGSAFQRGANIAFIATQTWSGSARGNQILIQTTPNNSTTITTALTIDQDQSLTVAGNLTTNGALTATGANSLNMRIGGGHTTFTSDTALALLRTDNSHNLISDSNFFIGTQGLEGCVSGCSAFGDLNTVSGNLSVTGPGFTIGGSTPVFNIISVNSSQVNNTPGMNFASAGGTLASLVATANATLLMQIAGQGYNGSTWGFGVNFGAVALETWSGTNNGAQLQFYANAIGTAYGSNSLVLTLDATHGAINYYPVVLHGASATTSGGSDVALGNTTAVSSNCGSLAGGAACLKFFIGSTPHYIPYF